MNDQDKKFYNDLMILLKKEFSELATKEDIARIKTDNKCILAILLILTVVLYILLYTIF